MFDVVSITSTGNYKFSGLFNRHNNENNYCTHTEMPTMCIYLYGRQGLQPRNIANKLTNITNLHSFEYSKYLRLQVVLSYLGVVG